MEGVIAGDLSSVAMGTKKSDNHGAPEEAGAERPGAMAADTAPMMVVKIISATYGPCEGRRLLTGESVTDGDDQSSSSSIPYTRDVAPVMRALLLAQAQSTTIEDNDNQNVDTDDALSSDPTIIRMSSLTQRGGMKRAHIPVLDRMKGMNACFGDPCPGVSKRLHVSYIVTSTTTTTMWEPQIHRTSFAEHEKVLLHHRPLSRQQQEKETASEEPDAGETTPDSSSSQSTSCLAESQQTPNASTTVMPTRPSSTTSWRLRLAISEVVLPLVMDYLSIPERVHARCVCRGWRRIIRDWGVATVIDNNDIPGGSLTRPFLRGLLRYSYSSLQSLFLSGLEDLTKADLHPSIPHLRKLRSLDVSRCIQLDDETLHLLAQHCGETLQVLYIKGLRRVTDQGMLAICDKCTKLRVLEISNIPLTDVSGGAIGQRLVHLTAIYMRDNFRLTNTSITAITNNCHKLEQLTLWGCTRIQELQFAAACREKLFLLNLWGCHGLSDNAAAALEGMACLRTLIVSECHRLTDTFFVSYLTLVGILCAACLEF